MLQRPLESTSGATIGVINNLRPERLVVRAFLSARDTKSVLIRASIAWPTTSQVNKSLMSVRYSHSCAVGTYVMSVNQPSLGRLATNVQANTFSATGSERAGPNLRRQATVRDPA